MCNDMPFTFYADNADTINNTDKEKIPVKIANTIDIALIGFSSKGSQNKIERTILENIGFSITKFIKTTTNIGNELITNEYN